MGKGVVITEISEKEERGRLVIVSVLVSVYNKEDWWEMEEKIE